VPPPPGLVFISSHRYPGLPRLGWDRSRSPALIGGTFPVFQMWRSPTFDFDFAGDIFCKRRVCYCSQRRTDSHPTLLRKDGASSAMLQFPLHAPAPAARTSLLGADRGPWQARFWLDGKGFWRNKKRASQGALILNLGVGLNFSVSWFSEVQLRGAVVHLL
jgi:hypothetical protein